MLDFSHANLLLSAIVAFFAMVLTVWFVSPAARHIGLVDMPGGRKQHKSPTPVVGGLCMYVSFCFALLTLGHSLQSFRGFLAATAILVFVGVLDDLKELSAKARFTAQILAAVVMVIWSHNVIFSFGNLLFHGDIHLGVFAIPVTIFATVAVINSVNMMDGTDGLLGTVAVIQLSFLCLMSWEMGKSSTAAVIAMIMAVIFGYLLFNFPFSFLKKAKIFMGDAGSMFIGLCLVWFCIHLTQIQHPHFAPVTMLWIIAVPLFDTTHLLIKRSLKGKNPLAPGRDHLHHLLMAFGYSDIAICLLIGSATLILACFGYCQSMLPITQSSSFLLFLFLFFIYFISMHYAWKNIRQRHCLAYAPQEE